MDSQTHAPNPVICGLILFLSSLTIVMFEIHLLIAIWRVSRTVSPFLLFFSHGCATVCYLLNLVWFSLEIIFGKEVPIPARLLSLIIRFFIYAQICHFVAIAMSRCIVIFTPLTYNKLVSRRLLFPNICIVCWTLGLLISLAETFCVGAVSDDAFPTHNIREMAIKAKDDNAQGAQIQYALDVLALILAISCLFFYVAAVMKLLIWKLFGAGANRNAWTTQFGDTHNYLITDQMRLFLTCLFCYIPYLALLLLTIFVLPKIERQWNGFVTTCSIILVSAVEPLVLFLMSRQVRTEFPAYCWALCGKKTTSTTPTSYSGHRNTNLA